MPSRVYPAILLFVMVGATLAAGPRPRGAQTVAQMPAPTRRVNAPYIGSGDPFTPAIFWLGQVDATNNYADVRVDYTEDVLAIVVHVIDRRLWNDTTPTAAELPAWDAVSIYLNKNGNIGAVPGPGAYRFEAELGNDYQTAYQGNGAGWAAASIPIYSYTEWRGATGPNSDSDSEGWVAYFYVPYTSVGLSTPPASGTQWGLALVLHDRDDAAGATQRDTLWPETMNQSTPSTWGLLTFGLPGYSAPPAAPAGTVTLRRGLNGVDIVDGAVGGYTTCGNDGEDKWATWGDYNYSDPSVNFQFNIQNQWDIADWPCFSKFYITFPLDGLPAGLTILSASLTMTLRGTAGGGPHGPPPNSYIDVLTVDSDWDAATLTWNNAPLASENLGGTLVPPVNGEYSWDVSRAVAQAYSSGGPLRLALYSIDGEYHTGKYFYSSETDDWGGTVRPTLTIQYGNLCTSPDVTCSLAYFPLILQ